MNRQDAKDAKNSEPSEVVDKLAHQVIGAAIEVHRHHGPGHLEAVYESALAVELDLRKIPFQRQVPIGVTYKGIDVGGGQLDFLIGDLLIVELKAVEDLSGIHKAQVISYLRITKRQLALLINFNVLVLKDGVKRVVCTN